MQAQEFEKKTGIFKKTYSLAITIAPETQEQLFAEFRHVKEALVNWKARRGEKCDAVLFSVVAEPEMHDAVKSLLAQVYSGERDLSPILQSVKVLVGILGKDGRPVSEYELTAP